MKDTKRAAIIIICASILMFGTIFFTACGGSGEPEEVEEEVMPSRSGTNKSGDMPTEAASPQPSREAEEIEIGGQTVAVNISELDLSYKQFDDFSPLESLIYLTKLNLSYTRVSDLAPLRPLIYLTELNISYTQISDLTPLEELTGLTVLYLSNTRVSDLTPLEGLTGLTVLNVSYTQISDLTPLEGLAGLTELNVSNTQISDLTPLYSLTGLTYLNIEDINLTGRQISDLIKALPDCEIYWSEPSPATPKASPSPSPSAAPPSSAPSPSPSPPPVVFSNMRAYWDTSNMGGHYFKLSFDASWTLSASDVSYNIKCTDVNGTEMSATEFPSAKTSGSGGSYSKAFITVSDTKKVQGSLTPGETYYWTCSVTIGGQTYTSARQSFVFSTGGTGLWPD